MDKRSSEAQASASARLRFRIEGAVQGVGFRPFVYRLATELALSGRVRNDVQGVLIEVEGIPARLEQFRSRLGAELRPPARILRQHVEEIAPTGATSFLIETSDAVGPKSALLLPELATCDPCLAEVNDPNNRRYRYPFTNCTHCGPRFSIIRALPYDRPSTTMADFSMCSACQREYDDPLDRRFHAQPNACAVCGPKLTLVDGAGAVVASDQIAIEQVAQALRDGQVVAVKGLGGFHLMVDATSDSAVALLRRRKGRPRKPFGLMVRDLAAARALCELTDAEALALASPEAPLVLVRRRALTSLSGGVAPGNPYVALMLPATPLHHLLCAAFERPLVATSGNLSDEPICIDNDEALARLGAIADLFLIHDRPIARHVDDSIVWDVAGALRVLRRARGYAPMPLTGPEHLPASSVAVPVLAARVPPASRVPPNGSGPRAPDEPKSTLRQVADGGGAVVEVPSVLAVGAHLKSTVALSVGERIFVSQHIGDLDAPEAQSAFEKVIADFVSLYDARLVAIAHDLHPEYASTEWAHRDVRAPRIAVQHHHAHLTACLLDAGVTGPALGIIWDGTGLGPDGMVWGGELLLGDARGYERVGHLRPFRLLGGDAAAREPWRVALALLWELYGEAAFEQLSRCVDVPALRRDRAVLTQMLSTGLRSPWTTSAGRLFDGVASLLGLCQTQSFEGEAAMALEFAANGPDHGASKSGARGPEPLGRTREAGGTRAARTGTATDAYDPVRSRVLDWGPLVETILADRDQKVPTAVLAARFHQGLIDAMVHAVVAIGVPRVALSGGCFQNRVLVEGATTALREQGFEVLLHRELPPNDGCISAGQLMVAMAKLGYEKSEG